MDKIYYLLIVKGKKTIDDIPIEWKEAVQKLLDESGAESNV